MEIERVEVIRYALPFALPYSTARGTIDSRELVLLQVHSEGLTGYGEAAAMTLRGADSAAQLVAELSESTRELLVGETFDPERPERSLIPFRNRGVRPELLACVDIGLHDLAAKSRDLPLWKMLGADSVRPVRCNGTLPMANPADLSRLAGALVDEGFDTLKLKVGVPGDTAQVEAVRKTVGDRAKIRLDANGSWGREEATKRISGLGGSSLELVEEPTSGLEGLREVRERSPTRIAADESISSPREAEKALEMQACDLVALKLAKTGGISPALEIAQQMTAYMTSALEGPVGIAAAAHVAQAIDSGDLASGLATERLFSVDIGSPGEWVGPELHLRDAPGLGVELDEVLLQNHTVG